MWRKYAHVINHPLVFHFYGWDLKKENWWGQLEKLYRLDHTWQCIHLGCYSQMTELYSWVHSVPSKIDGSVCVSNAALHCDSQWNGSVILAISRNSFFSNSKTCEDYHWTSWRQFCRRKSTNQFVMGKPLKSGNPWFPFIIESQEAGLLQRSVASWPAARYQATAVELQWFAIPSAWMCYAVPFLSNFWRIKARHGQKISIPIRIVPIVGLVTHIPGNCW